MKAFAYQEYGSVDSLALVDVPKPVPGDTEVLIKTRAVSLNASDWECLRGSPLYTRIWGLRRPRRTILGSDIAGTVEAVGNKVSRFKPGDAVLGDVLETCGGFADYVCAPQTALIRKPDSISFETAASVPQAASIALQGLRKGRIRAGMRVLINGAGGGAGSFAIQLASQYGAQVTGVDSAEKLDLVRQLGASEVIDYTREDFTRSGQRYDLILDFVAAHSIFAYKRALKPGGAYVMVGGTIPHLLQCLVLGGLFSLLGKQSLGVLAAEPNKGLAEILTLIESGQLTPVIDRCFPLSQLPQAFTCLGQGRAKGKVVIRIGAEGDEQSSEDITLTERMADTR